MQQPQQPADQTESHEAAAWLNPRLKHIPVGSPFQADIPEWTGPPDADQYKRDSSKWLGRQVWPPYSNPSQESPAEEIGKGKPNSCTCTSAGSLMCIKRHMAEKRSKMKGELGIEFWRMKFNEMGEEMANQWTSDEEKMFVNVVKRNPISNGKGFLKPAVERLDCQTRQSIMNYYYNVYVPRKISSKNVSDGVVVYSEDDEAGNKVDKPKPKPKPKPKRSLKRSRGGKESSLIRQ